MKLYNLLVVFLVMGSALQNLYAQSECKVLLEAIAEGYEGGCRKGLAYGEGIAWGIDRYEGRFRAGLPHGSGKYTWADGSNYHGSWQEGQRHGRGTLTFQKDDEWVSTTGYWQNDEFTGHEKIAPYVMGHVLNVERHNIRRRDDGNMILVTVYEQGGRANPYPPDFTFNLSTGSHITQGQARGYEGVSFPANVIITYNMPDKLQQGAVMRVRYEVVINVPGIWEIRLYH